MGYKTLFEQIKTVCAWNSLKLAIFEILAGLVHLKTL